LDGAPYLLAGGTRGTTGGTTQGSLKPPANSLTIKVEAPAAVAPPTLRELIARAQGEGLAELELIARVQGLAITHGLEQPFGSEITMTATVMARSHG
jgi:hypothetical protein